MKIEVVASGSQGNLTVISSDKTNIVIDAGISYKQYSSRSNIKDHYNALLITHEHSDHTKFLNSLSKKLACPIFMNHDSFDNCYHKYKDGLIKDEVFNLSEENNFMVGDILVTPFKLSHDAKAIFGFVFECEKKIVYLTDTGYVKEDVLKLIYNADIYLIESNHEVEMVLVSSRPWTLKQRILSQVGHLSNEEACVVLNKIVGDNTKKIIFMHLSRECNSIELANLTHRNYLNNHQKYELIYAKQDESTGEISI